MGPDYDPGLGVQKKNHFWFLSAGVVVISWSPPAGRRRRVFAPNLSYLELALDVLGNNSYGELLKLLRF